VDVAPALLLSQEARQLGRDGKSPVPLEVVHSFWRARP